MIGNFFIRNFFFNLLPENSSVFLIKKCPIFSKIVTVSETSLGVDQYLQVYQIVHQHWLN